MAQFEVITKDIIIDVLTNQWLTKPELFKHLPPIREQSTVKVINDYLDTLIKKGIIVKKIISGRICYRYFENQPSEKPLKQKSLEKVVTKKDSPKKSSSNIKIGKTVYTPDKPKSKPKPKPKTTKKRSTKKTTTSRKEDVKPEKKPTIMKKEEIKKEDIKKEDIKKKVDKKIPDTLVDKGDKKETLKIKTKDVNIKKPRDQPIDEGVKKETPKIRIESKDVKKVEPKLSVQKPIEGKKKPEKPIKMKSTPTRRPKEIKKSGILPTREEIVSKKEEIGADRGYQQQSPAEFFKKNKAIAGFDNDQKAVYTIVRELVENSIDAAESIRKLPEIYLRLQKLKNDVYLISIKDNGSGVPDEEIPKCFGILLYGSKYVRIQGRGHFGMGGKMAILYGQISTLEPVVVKSSTDGNEIYYYKMRIDIKNNEPIIEDYEVLSNPDKWIGTYIEFKFKGDYPRVKKKILEYLNKTAIITPHAQIEYIEPIDDRCENCRNDRIKNHGEVMYCKNCFNKFIHNIYISNNFTLRKVLTNKLSGIDKNTLKKLNDTIPDIINLDVDKLQNLRKIYNQIENIIGTPIGITKDNLILKINKYVLKFIKTCLNLSSKYKKISDMDNEDKKHFINLINNLKILSKYVGGKSYSITGLTPKNLKELLDKEKKYSTRAKNFNVFLLDTISGLGKKTLEKVEDDYGSSLKIDIYEAEEKINLNRLYEILLQNLTSGLPNIRDLTFIEFEKIIQNTIEEKTKYVEVMKKNLEGYTKKDAFLSQKEPYKFINKEVKSCPYCNSDNIINIGTWQICQVSSCKYNYLNIYRHIYRRGTTELPPNPIPSLPHPHGTDADSLLEMIKAELSEFYITYEPTGNYSMKKLLGKKIRGIGKETINKIEELTKESLEKDADKYRNIIQLYNVIKKAVGFPIGIINKNKKIFNIKDLSLEKFKEIVEKEKSKGNIDIDKLLKSLFYGFNVKILNNIKEKLKINKTQKIPSNIDLDVLYNILIEKLPSTNIVDIKELTLKKLRELVSDFEKEKHEEFKKASPTFYSFMNKRFQRTGKKTIANFCEFVRKNSKLELYPETLLMDLDKSAIVKITDMLQKFPFQRPDASCLAPIGEELLLKGIMKEIDPEWASTVQRPPEVCEGHPFIIEMGLAYGGKIDSSGDYLQRFANRIPLLYESSMGVCATAIKKINWRHYKLDLDKMPIHIFIHIVSTKIPWGRFGKEYIANKPEIRNEIDLGIRYLARQLQTYLSKIKKKESTKKRINKLKIFGNIIIEPLAELVEKNPLEVYRIINGYLLNQGSKRKMYKNPYKNFSGFFEDLEYFGKYDIKYLNQLLTVKGK
ncbi:MAG: ATP-binding protein [Candidatus Helarchaeota archaeon]